MVVKNEGNFKITKEQQIKELIERVPPILNVDVVVFKKDLTDKKNIYKFLIGHRNPNKLVEIKEMEEWLFPGGRMKYTETPQEAAERILRKELPGVKAQLKKLGTAISDKGYDHRANGVTLFYLYEYIEGEPSPNEDLDKFIWLNSNDMIKQEFVYDIDASILSEMEAIIRTMNTTEDEMIVEVDENDKEIGSEIKRVLHSDNTRYHRAAHMMIFTSKGDVILHQRSFLKSNGAGLWDMFGGHQVYGHTIEQTAKQELMEELGVETDLKFKKSWLFKSEKQAEYCYVYYGVSDGPYGYDRNEVEQIKIFDCEKLLNGEYDKEYEFVEPFTKMYLEDLRSFWKELKFSIKDN